MLCSLLPMLVIALQFYTGDWYRAMRLAKLLADLEVRHRDDVTLVLVRTTECPGGKVVGEVARRCSEVFDVEELVIRPDTPARRARWGELGRWPVGCNVLLHGAVEHFLESDPRWTSLFMADGGDSVPLHRNWLDILVEDHQRTVDAGLQITGDVRRDGLGRWHVNANMVVERSFFVDHPEVTVMPEPGEPFDMYYASTYLPASRGSSVLRCEWQKWGLRPGSFAEVAREAAWWHGYKDGHFVELAREFILGGSHPAPVLVDRGRGSDLADSP